MCPCKHICTSFSVISDYERYTSFLTQLLTCNKIHFFKSDGLWYMYKLILFTYIYNLIVFFAIQGLSLKRGQKCILGKRGNFKHSPIVMYVLGRYLKVHIWFDKDKAFKVHCLYAPIQKHLSFIIDTPMKNFRVCFLLPDWIGHSLQKCMKIFTNTSV